jgi:activator of HSP90 ATPase
MATTITQKLVFKNATLKKIYDLYMDAKLHSKIAGSPAKISRKLGADFSVHGGYITGKNIYLIKDKLITQTWRAQDWDSMEPDSIFTILLESKGKDVVLHAIHAGVPDKSAAGIDKGWHDHYWKPWKQYLAGKEITRPQM